MYTPFAHNIVDLPIGFPTAQYFVVHEILDYHPATDDDMSWTLYFEPAERSVDFQLGASNAQSGIDAFLASQAQIIQFPIALGRPIADAGPASVTIDCGCQATVLVHLTGAQSQANSQPGVSIDSIAHYTWRHEAGPGAVSGQVVGGQVDLDILLAAGIHELQLTVEDECGNLDSARVFVTVQDCAGTGDFNLDGVIDLQVHGSAFACLSGPTPNDVPADCQSIDFDCDGDGDLRDFSRFQQVFRPLP